MMDQQQAQTALIEALRRPQVYPHPADDIQVLQTHISSVVLAGGFAYKIKKPIDLGFLDFSTLERRRHFCEEELRLNRRLAPTLYLDVVRFTGTPQAPIINGTGEAFEYAVRMRRFQQEMLLDRILARNALPVEIIESVAVQLAAFHVQAGQAGADSHYGNPDVAFFPMQQNFDQLRPLIKDPRQCDQLARLEQWTQAHYAVLHDTLAARKKAGRIRECHGDLHLGNIALEHGDILIFDGIEFNPDLRWTDVMSEVAFLSMDLTDRGADAFAHRFVNAYLEQSGDFGGLDVLRFYQVYRAMVRAKVASLRLAQGVEDAERREILTRYQGYANLAERFTRPGRPALVLMHGVSGSGKTTRSVDLIERFGAIRVRSDVERKRMHGLGATERISASVNAGLYTPEKTEQTYTRLADCAATILRAGHVALIDATFLEASRRARFATLARELGVPFLVLSIQADEARLLARITQRMASDSDASDADIDVLRNQLANIQPFEPHEPVIVVDSDAPMPFDRVAQALGQA